MRTNAWKIPGDMELRVKPVAASIHRGIHLAPSTIVAVVGVEPITQFITIVARRISSSLPDHVEQFFFEKIFFRKSCSITSSKRHFDNIIFVKQKISLTTIFNHCAMNVRQNVTCNNGHSVTDYADQLTFIINNNNCHMHPIIY